MQLRKQSDNKEKKNKYENEQINQLVLSTGLRVEKSKIKTFSSTPELKPKSQDTGSLLDEPKKILTSNEVPQICFSNLPPQLNQELMDYDKLKSPKESKTENHIKKNSIKKSLKKQAKSYLKQAENSYEQNEYKEALRQWQCSLAIQQKVNLEEKLLINTFYGIGKLYFKLGDYYQALRYCLQALNKKNKGQFIAEITHLIGDTYYNLSEYEKALKNYENALEYRSKKNLLGIIDSKNKIGMVHLKKNNFKDALKYHEKAHDLLNKNYPEKQKNRKGKTLDYLGNVFHAMGNNEKAENNYKKALELYDDHNKIARSNTLSNLGCLYRERGEYRKAHSYYSAVVDIRKNIFVENHPNIAASLINLANIYSAQGYHEEALELYEKGCNIQRSHFGNNHSEISSTLDNMAIEYCLYKNNYDKALELSTEALKMRQEILSKDHPLVVKSYVNIAWVYKKKGEYKKALNYYSLAYQIGEKIGREHLAPVLNHKGYLHEAGGDYAEAINNFKQALEIYKNKGDLSHIYCQVKYKIAQLQVKMCIKALAKNPQLEVAKIFSDPLRYLKELYQDHLTLLTKSLDSIRSVYDLVKYDKLLEDLIEIYHYLGQWEKAYTIYFEEAKRWERFPTLALKYAKKAEQEQRFFSIEPKKNAQLFMLQATLFSEQQRWPRALKALSKSYQNHTALTIEDQKKYKNKKNDYEEKWKIELEKLTMAMAAQWQRSLDHQHKISLLLFESADEDKDNESLSYEIRDRVTNIIIKLRNLLDQSFFRFAQDEIGEKYKHDEEEKNYKKRGHFYFPFISSETDLTEYLESKNLSNISISSIPKNSISQVNKNNIQKLLKWEIIELDSKGNASILPPNNDGFTKVQDSTEKDLSNLRKLQHKCKEKNEAYKLILKHQPFNRYDPEFHHSMETEEERSWLDFIMSIPNENKHIRLTPAHIKKKLEKKVGFLSHWNFKVLIDYIEPEGIIYPWSFLICLIDIDDKYKRYTLSEKIYGQLYKSRYLIEDKEEKVKVNGEKAAVFIKKVRDHKPSENKLSQGYQAYIQQIIHSLRPLTELNENHCKEIANILLRRAAQLEHLSFLPDRELDLEVLMRHAFNGVYGLLTTLGQASNTVEIKKYTENKLPPREKQNTEKIDTLQYIYNNWKDFEETVNDCLRRNKINQLFNGYNKIQQQENINWLHSYFEQRKSWLASMSPTLSYEEKRQVEDKINSDLDFQFAKVKKDITVLPRHIWRAVCKDKDLELEYVKVADRIGDIAITLQSLLHKIFTRWVNKCLREPNNLGFCATNFLRHLDSNKFEDFILLCIGGINKEKEIEIKKSPIYQAMLQLQPFNQKEIIANSEMRLPWLTVIYELANTSKHKSLCEFNKRQILTKQSLLDELENNSYVQIHSQNVPILPIFKLALEQIGHILDLLNENLKKVSSKENVFEKALVKIKIKTKNLGNLEFLIEEKENFQLGWNCFDLAIDLSRNELVRFALEHKTEIEYRQLLSPEIRTAAVITAVLLNVKEAATKNSERSVLRFFELFHLLELAQRFGTEEHVSQAASTINQELKQSEKGAPFIQNLKTLALPEELHKKEVQQLVNAYHDAHEAKEKKNEVITEKELELKAYCEREDVYESYVNNYYGKNKWFVFQPDLKQPEKNNTSMVDIAARCKNQPIVIHTTKEKNWETVYCTKETKEQKTAEALLHVEYRDIGRHFVALKPNPVYFDHVASLLSKLGLFKKRSTGFLSAKEKEEKYENTQSSDEILTLVKQYLVSQSQHDY